MYTLGLKKNFIARHQLVGGDWGSENDPHSHHYVVELKLSANQLDHHGYLVDLVDVESILNEVVSRYADQMLNTLPAFENSNPSLERFVRILWNDLRTIGESVDAFSVRLWENDEAWAEWSGGVS